MSNTIKDMPFRVKKKDDIKFWDSLGDDLKSMFGGGKCHCDMCGENNAGNRTRKLYLSNKLAESHCSHRR